MPLEQADLEQIGKLIAGAIAPLAGAVSPENLAKTITPIIEAQNKAAGVVTAAELAKRDADAKKAADDAAAAKVAADAAEAAKKGKKDEAPVVPPEVLELQKQLALITKSNEDNARKAAEADAARKADALHSATKEALAKAGVPADRIHLALPALKEAGVLVYDGERPGWKGTDPKTNTPAVLDMLDGVKGWVEGDGKHFLPPKDLGGSGEGIGVRGGGSRVSSPLRNSDGSLNLDAAADSFVSNLGR